MYCITDNKGYKIAPNKGVEAFTIECNNTTGASRTYKILDTLDFVTGALQKVGTFFPTGGTIDPVLIAASCVANSIYSTGFNYQTNNPSQFSQNFEFIMAEIDGNAKRFPLITEQLRRNSQFQNTLLLVEFPMLINLKSALLLNVLPNTDVSLTFYVDRICNTPNC